MADHDLEGDALAAELRAELLAAGVPAHDVEPSPGQDERMEAALAAILHAGAVPARRERRHRSRRPLLWRAGALAAAAAVIAALLLARPFSQEPAAAALTPPLLTFDSAASTQFPLTGQQAREQLLDLATRARDAAPGRAGPIQRIEFDSWWSSTVDTATAGPVSSLEPVRSQTYVLPDATIRAIERRGRPLDADGRIDTGIDWANQPVTSDDTFTSPDPGPGYAMSLPTNPTRLRRVLAKSHDDVTCGGVEGACMLGDVIELYRSYVVPPALAAALWQVLAGEPSISYVGHTVDRLHRDAIAFVTADIDHVSQLLVFADPSTGAFLGDEVVLVKPSPDLSYPPPAVTSFSALVEARRISADQLPPP